MHSLRQSQMRSSDGMQVWFNVVKSACVFLRGC